MINSNLYLLATVHPLQTDRRQPWQQLDRCKSTVG